MDETPKAPTREERLAAQLRENLKRRKAQARAQSSEARVREGRDAAALSKPDPKS